MDEKAILKIDDVFDLIRDIRVYFKHTENNNYELIDKILKETKDLKEECVNKTNPPLIALKEYTEGNATWSRAGEISTLGYFGLEQYCENYNVNTAQLRIDEYIGCTDTEDIKKQWLKLDPNHTMTPINYEGSGKPYLEDVSKKEKRDCKIKELNYTNKARTNISEYVTLFYKIYDKLHDDNNSLKKFNETIVQKTLMKLMLDFICEDEEEYTELIRVLNQATDYIHTADETKNITELENSYQYLKDNIHVGYSYSNIKK